MNVEYHGPWPRKISTGKNGVVETKKTVTLKGVTPEMLDWFNKNLDLDLYKKWHPDHIDRKKVERPGKSPIYLETQKIGNRVYRMKLIKSEKLPDGSHASTLRYPMFTFYNRSRTRATAEGVERSSEGWIGSSVPILGWAWNLYLRTFVLPGFMKLQFIHQDEESMNSMKILPGLYADYQKKQKRR